MPRQKKEALYREDTGVALATRAAVVRQGRRLGHNCHVIPYEQDVSFVDIHDDFDMWLAERILQDHKYELG